MYCTFYEGPVKSSFTNSLMLSYLRIFNPLSASECVLSQTVKLDLILYVPSTVFQLERDGSCCVEPELS